MVAGGFVRNKRLLFLQRPERRSILGRGRALYRLRDQAVVAGMEVFDFKKGGVAAVRLVDMEKTHQPERRGAFQGTGEVGATLGKRGCPHEASHLVGIEEKTSGMRVVDPNETKGQAKIVGFDRRLDGDVLEGLAEFRLGQVSINVDLAQGQEGIRFETIGLQQNVIAEFGGKEGELGEKEGISQAKIVFHKAIIVELPKGFGEHGLAFETEQHGFGLGGAVFEQAGQGGQAPEDVLVLGGADHDAHATGRCRVGAMNDPPGAVEQPLPRAERLVQARDQRSQGLCPLLGGVAHRTVEAVPVGIAEMRNADQDAHGSPGIDLDRLVPVGQGFQEAQLRGQTDGGEIVVVENGLSGPNPDIVKLGAAFRQIGQTVGQGVGVEEVG